MDYTCSRCKITKPDSDYPSRNGRRQGTRCKACHAAIAREKRAPIIAARQLEPKPLRDRDLTEKRCNRCGETKPVSEFYWSTRRWDHRCKSCRSEVEREQRAGTWQPLPPKPKLVKPPKPSAQRLTVDERF